MRSSVVCSFKCVSIDNAGLFAHTNLSLLITKQYKIIHLTFLVLMLKVKYTVLIVPLIKGLVLNAAKCKCPFTRKDIC